MVSLLQQILGVPQPDEQVDNRGLAPSNYTQMGWSGLANLGGVLAAIGAPSTNKAGAYEALGKVPMGMQALADNITNQRNVAENTLHTGQQTKDLQFNNRIRQAQQDMVKTPQFQSASPLQQAQMLAGVTADPKSLLEINKAQMPVQMGSGEYIPGVGLYNQYLKTVVPFAPGDTGRLPNQGTANPTAGSPPTIGNPVQSPQPMPGQLGGGPTPSPVGIQAPTVNQQALSQVPPEFQDVVRQIATGEDKYSVGRFPPDLQVAIQQWVHQVNPNYSPATYENRQKFLKDIAPSGKAGIQLTNAGTALDHSDDATAAFNDLNNTGFKPYNALTTTLGRLNPMGSPALTAYDTAIANFLEEGKKAVQGKAITEGERQHLASQISPNMTPAEFKSLVGTFNELMARRAQNTISGYHMTPEQVRDANDSVYNHLYGDKANVTPTRGPLNAGSSIPPQDPGYEYRQKPDGTWQRRAKQQ